jgi:hypothetical protein
VIHVLHWQSGRHSCTQHAAHNTHARQTPGARSGFSFAFAFLYSRSRIPMPMPITIVDCRSLVQKRAVVPIYTHLTTSLYKLFYTKTTTTPIPHGVHYLYMYISTYAIQFKQEPHGVLVTVRSILSASSHIESMVSKVGSKLVVVPFTNVRSIPRGSLL